jgi:hypothetical protein
VLFRSLAHVPKARYANGAITITNGYELRVVSPEAWRAYTGTALSADDAERLLARAERLDQGVRDLGAAASDLRSYLDGRARDARSESERLEAESEARRQIDASKHRQFAVELAAINAEEEQQLSGISAEREGEISRIAEAHGKRMIEISEEWEAKRSTLKDKQRREMDALGQQIRTERAIAENAKRNREDLMALDSRGERLRKELGEQQAGETSNLENQRTAAISSQREATEVRLADVRRLYASKEERVRQDASSKRQVILVQQGAASGKSDEAKPASPKQAAPMPKPTATAEAPAKDPEPAKTTEPAKPAAPAPTEAKP